MSSSQEERRIIVVSRELAEKIDLQRGELSREKFLEFCVDFCLRSGGLESERGVPRGEVEELRKNLTEVRREVVERLETISKAYERLYQLVSALEKQIGPKTPIPASLEAQPKGRGPKAGLVLLRWSPTSGPSIRARYPEDWSWDVRITEEMLTAIYALTLMSKSQTERMRLEFKRSKVASVAAKEDSLLLLVLDAEQDFKNYEEVIKGMAGEVGTLKDWERALPKLFEKYLSPL